MYPDGIFLRPVSSAPPLRVLCPADELLAAWSEEDSTLVAATGSAAVPPSQKRNPMKPDSLRVGPGVAVGVTELMIVEVVHAFYGRIRQDPTLAPIFFRVI